MCGGAALALLSAGAGTALAQTVTFDLETAKLSDLQQAMDNGALTSVELVNIYKQRIAAYDQGGPKLNSVPFLNPNVLEEAEEADALRKTGYKSNVLGVPFVVKGSVAVKDLALTNGINAWVNLISPYDAWIVAKLREAGAVFLGYANLDQFQTGTGGSTSQNWGTVRNAYVVNTNAGGSSGGSAVATGANFAFFAIGGETGGSIRIPADRAGVVGIKPSNGTISVRGVAPLAADRDTLGPMTRSAEDNAKVLDIVSALDGGDVWNLVSIVPGRLRPSAFETKEAAGTLSGKRIGVLSNFLNSGTTGIPGEINAALTEARAALTAAGATVVDVTLPIKSGDTTTYLDVNYPNRRDSVPTSITTAPQRKLYTDVLSDLTGNQVPEARGYHLEKFLESLVTSPDDPERKRKILAWIGPVATSSIPEASRNAILNGTTLGFESSIAQEHFQAVRYQVADYEAWMTANTLDALIFPVATNKTVGNSAEGSPISGSSTAPGRALINSFSLPFVTVPMGVLSTGEPTNLGFLGSRYWGDADVVALASAYEKVSNKRIVSPLAPALADERIEYVIGGTSGGGSTRDTTKPAASVRGGAKIVGNGKKARLEVTGVARDNVAVSRVTVTINGQRVPVRITSGGWETRAPLTRYRKLAARGVKQVSVVVVVRDRQGNTSSASKKITLPVDDLLDA